jgi:hypothetical protein
MAEPSETPVGSAAGSPHSDAGSRPRAPLPIFEPPPIVPLPIFEPPPIVPRPPYLRRAIELVPSAGVALPLCTAGDPATDRCVGLGPGVGVGAAGLWRLVPIFALGVAVNVAAFENEPPKRLGLRDASALSASLALLGRFYLLDEGNLDPYAELMLGAGVLGSSALEADGLRYDESGAGFLIALGTGLDFYMSNHFRFGPALTWTNTFVRNVRRCPTTGTEECDSLPTSTHGVLHGALEFGARLTLLLGSEN